MSEKIDIINRALARIGSQAIQSETARGADRALKIYDDQLAVCAGSKPFSFTIRTTQLVQSGEDEDAGFFDYAYKLPADRLGLPLAVYEHPTGDPFHDFEYRERVLVCNAKTIFVKYQVVPDQSNWTPLFREAVIVLCAAELAMSRNEDAAQRANLRTSVFGDQSVPGDLGILGQASRLDARSKSSRVLTPPGGGPFVRTRRG